MKNAQSLSDGELDAAYGAAFNSGDHIAMDYFSQEIITRQQTTGSFVASLWRGTFGSAPRFPIYESKIGQTPPTPGLLPQNTPAAPGFKSSEVAVASFNQRAGDLFNKFEIAGMGIGVIIVAIAIILLILRFKK